MSLVRTNSTRKPTESVSPTDTEQPRMHQILLAMLALRNGDFSQRLPAEWPNIYGKIAETFNDILMASDQRARETERICRLVGKEGRLKQRMTVPGVVGGWADEIKALNTLIDDLVWPTVETTRAIGAVAKGDLGQSMALEMDGRDLKGDFLRSAKLVNKMIDQLAVFTSEVTRVAREVGSAGKLGGQAQVTGVSGVWRELTDSVNSMASNLTAQVRNIADVTIAVANGDLSRKITVDVRGEMLQLKETINRMVDQLIAFASEVTQPPIENKDETAPSADGIRVMIVDDNLMLRREFRRVLSRNADIEVIGDASDGEAATQLARDLQPDVILMDLSMPRMDGLEATSIIHAEFPGIRIIGLSMYEEPEHAAAMRSAGAVNYLTKGCPPKELAAAIRDSMQKSALIERMQQVS